MSAPEPMTEERLKEIEAFAALNHGSFRSMDAAALVAGVRRLQVAMVEIRRHISWACGHKRRPDQLGACLTAIRDLSFGESPRKPGTTP